MTVSPATPTLLAGGTVRQGTPGVPDSPEMSRPVSAVSRTAVRASAEPSPPVGRRSEDAATDTTEGVGPERAHDVEQFVGGAEGKRHGESEAAAAHSRNVPYGDRVRRSVSRRSPSGPWPGRGRGTGHSSPRAPRPAPYCGSHRVVVAARQSATALRAWPSCPNAGAAPSRPARFPSAASAWRALPAQQLAVVAGAGHREQPGLALQQGCECDGHAQADEARSAENRVASCRVASWCVVPRTVRP